MSLKKLTLVVAICIGISCSSLFADDTNIVVKQAEKAGVKKCLPAIKSLSAFIIKNGDAGANSSWNSKNPDNNVFSSSIERTFSDGVMFTDLTVSPVTSGACSAIYNMIYYESKSCMAVAKDKYEKAKYKGELNKSITFLDDNDVDTYLMPAGAGCIVIRKESVMNANELK